MTRTTPSIDLRAALPRNQDYQNKWLVKRDPSHITYDFVHYADQFCPPGADQAAETLLLAADANYHIQKDWGSPPNPQNPVHGWCIMYHWAIGQSGFLYLLNDKEDVLWNTTYGNPVGVATVLLLGQNQQPSIAMLNTLRSHLGDNEADPSMRIIRARTFGHGECPAIYGQGPDFGNNTDCPGAALAWVRAYRTALPGPPQPIGSRFFPETGHYIGHGFRDRWEALETLAIGGANLALMTVGYPISEEHDQVIGGQNYVVQDFQHLRMEFHPENKAPYDILFGLCDAELLASRVGAMVIGH